MYQDAYDLIQGLVDGNEKIHFIAFTKGGDLLMSISTQLTPLTFKSIDELLECTETL